MEYFHNPSCAGTSGFALISFPKKLSGGVDDTSWGLHACEQLSALRVIIALVLGLAPTLAFAPYWLHLHHGDMQGAFTPSAIFLAFAAICFEVCIRCATP